MCVFFIIMSFLKNKFNRVFSSKSSRTVSPSVSFTNSNIVNQQPCHAYDCIDFCNRDVHDPLYDCCFGLEIDNIQSGINYTKKYLKKKQKPIIKRPKSSLGTFTSSLVFGGSNRPSSSTLSSKVSPACLQQPSLKTKTSLATSSLTSTHSPYNISEKSIQHRPRSCQQKFTTTIQTLCDTFDTISMSAVTPRLTKLYPTIPEHDKKILNRMAMKRHEEIVRMEDAHLARKYWEAERNARNHMLTEHNAQLMDELRTKRHQESVEMKERLQMIAERHDTYLNKIKTEISSKNHKLLQRMRTAELKKELRKCERRQVELRKFEAAAMQLQDTELDEALRRQECYSQLEARISRADALRAHFLAVYRRRLFADNEMQQTLHAANYEEAQKIEQYKIEMLKLRIRSRNRKCVDFMKRKQQFLLESRDQARATAELRDIVRRSISPDNYSSIRGSRLAVRSDRPISNMSLYESNVRLG